MATTEIPQSVIASLQISRRNDRLFGTSRTWGSRLSEQDVEFVIDAFESTQTRWVLVGAHAIGQVIEPRATADFDFIVDDKKLKAVLEKLQVRFGDLGMVEAGAAVRLAKIDVDMIRASNHALFREALASCQLIAGWRLPSREMLLVLKFLSAVNPWDQNKRGQDLLDLRRVYQVSESLDRDELRRLSAMVYPRADQEFAALLDKIDRGEPLEV